MFHLRGGTSTDGSFLSMGSLSTPVAKSFDNPPFYQHDHSDLGLPLRQAREQCILFLFVDEE